jgi:ribosomal protein S18 acetylase RimI-like enzyme
LELRKYTDSDKHQVLDLLQHEEIDPNTNEPYEMEFFTQDFYVRFIAIEKEKIVGVIAFSKQFTTIELNFIYVKEDYRNTHVSQQLFEMHTVFENMEGIRVNCGGDNVRAQKFYEKLGFQKVGEVKNYFSNNNTQFFYWRPVQ